MKNKHLLLIFACTLLTGLLAKYTPWFKGDIFQTDLLRLTPNEVQRIAISRPGKEELLLERSDEGWVASQEDFAVRTADSLVAPLLTALSQFRSLRIVHVTQTDTLGLAPSQAIRVQVFMKNGRKEIFDVGRETQEQQQAATYVEMDQHEGVYLASKHLRQVFDRTIDDFRSKTVFDLKLENLQAVRIERPGIDTISWQKSDTSAMWWRNNRNELPQRKEQVSHWLGQVQQLNGLPFASHTDEGQAPENLAANISFKMMDSIMDVQLQFYQTRANVYHTKRLATRNTPELVVISSQNSAIFFALFDTTLAKKIWNGPVIVPD
jgi:hypothetical protein